MSHLRTLARDRVKNSPTHLNEGRVAVLNTDGTTLGYLLPISDAAELGTQIHRTLPLANFASSFLRRRLWETVPSGGGIQLTRPGQPSRFFAAPITQPQESA